MLVSSLLFSDSLILLDHIVCQLFESDTHMPWIYAYWNVSKWFYNTSTGAATGAACCGSLIGKGFSLLVVSYWWTRWTQRFTWFRPLEHNTLRPRENWVVLLKPVLPVWAWAFFLTDPYEVAPAWAFYSSMLGSYNDSQGPTGGLGVGQTLCCRAQRLGVANDVFNGVGMPGLIACHTALGQSYGMVSLHH
jgi:hypothetical protein